MKRPQPPTEDGLWADDLQSVLLVNPPVFDTRLPWATWLQPTALQRLATYYTARGADVRFVDCLQNPERKLPRRKRATVLDLDGIRVNKWRFGRPATESRAEFSESAMEGWRPKRIYVECLASMWWEGAAEVVGEVASIFPKAEIVLVGPYAKLVADHIVVATGAETIAAEIPDRVRSCRPSTDLLPRPSVLYLSTNSGRRAPDDMADEIEKALAAGVRDVAFSEHGVVAQWPDLFRTVLERIVEDGLRVRLTSLGAIGAPDLAAQPDLPGLMLRAGYRQVVLADDRDTPSGRFDDEWLDAHRVVAERFAAAGARPRTDKLVASLSIGRRADSLVERARAATLLAHHVGSVIAWPYQPAPGELPNEPLEHQNGRLFPLRSHGGHSYGDYARLLGLVVVLNAKHRTQTFDFLGDGPIASLFRDSVRRNAWNAPDDIKGTTKLPVLAR